MFLVEKENNGYYSTWPFFLMSDFVTHADRWHKKAMAFLK